MADRGGNLDSMKDEERQAYYESMRQTPRGIRPISNKQLLAKHHQLQQQCDQYLRVQRQLMSLAVTDASRQQRLLTQRLDRLKEDRKRHHVQREKRRRKEAEVRRAQTAMERRRIDPDAAIASCNLELRDIDVARAIGTFAIDKRMRLFRPSTAPPQIPNTSGNSDGTTAPASDTLKSWVAVQAAVTKAQRPITALTTVRECYTWDYCLPMYDNSLAFAKQINVCINHGNQRIFIQFEII